MAALVPGSKSPGRFNPIRHITDYVPPGSKTPPGVGDSTLPSGYVLPHTGYPFLQLARRYNVDYSDVLLAADWFSCAMSLEHKAMQRTVIIRLPPPLLLDIRALLALPVAERGGPH